MFAQAALKYDVEVTRGAVELTLPFPAGRHVIVFVLESGDTFADLLYASQTRLEFWDNPLDDDAARRST